jgi:hypothetical protein
MTAKRSSLAEHSISGNSMTLDDLRWLVWQCRDFSENSLVETKEGKMISSVEMTHDNISVKGEISRNGPPA